MKITSLFVYLSYFSLPLIYGQPLTDVLIDRGFDEYAANLLAYPALLARLEGRNDITVWAVPNKHVTPFSGSKPYLFRRQTPSEISQSISHTGPPPVPAKKKRQAGNAPSNFQTLRTFLEDPTFVNLGPGEPNRVVSSYTDSPPGSDQANIQITSGLGAVVNQISGPFKYDNGLIYGVANFFTPPRPLFETLKTLGLDVFRDAIIAAGREEELSKTPGVTIFAPANGTFDASGINVDAHTISDGFFFTPELFDKGSHQSDAGTTLSITLEGGSFYVNGIRIIKSDVSIKNGVVHVIEKPLEYKKDKKHHYKPRGAART